MYADFVAADESERDLIYRAAASPDDAEARGLAGGALARMRARGARFFTGENAKLSELEDIFLTMEGIAQWAGYSWLIHPRGPGIAPEAALTGMRRGGRQWSRDEGLAIFLVVDRLVPDWQARAFAPQPATAMELLALAAAPPVRLASQRAKSPHARSAGAILRGRFPTWPQSFQSHGR